VGHHARVILAILDGLRPDVITPEVMPVLDAVGRAGWRATATTVSPSVTVAALGSLATGVSPAVHGLREGKLPPLGRLGALRPLPAVLRAHRRRTMVITGALAAGPHMVARALLGIAGIGDVVAGGSCAGTVGALTLRHVRRSALDLTIVYLNQCDMAGHRDGWMSPRYVEAARRLDAVAAPLAEAAVESGALLLVTADHGGGGLDPRDHDGAHPINSTIPLIAAGPGLRPDSPVPDDAHLLDIPPTILAALGLPIPPSYEGRVLPLVHRVATAA
jgi:predicted AlkP superfamily pyrophosphatase or phosphodiesterase